MHTMIDLTVYFLFFIACSSGAVFRKKGMEPDNDKTLPEPRDFRMEHDFFKVFEDMHLKMQEESETFPMYKKNRDSLFKTSFHESEDDDDNNDVLPSVSNSTDKATEGQDADPWSVIWYLGAFSGLITFFLVVTCSEWCCGNHLYTRHYGANHIYANSFTHTSYKPPETPPPPYHLFAPPSYNDSIKNCQEKQKPPKKSNIFIIPIHRIRRNSNT